MHPADSRKRVLSWMVCLLGGAISGGSEVCGSSFGVCWYIGSDVLLAASRIALRDDILKRFHVSVVFL